MWYVRWPWKVWVGWSVGGMALLMLVGCAAMSSRDSTGQANGDAAITAQVRSSFQADPLVSVAGINVETHRGVVHLSGTLSNEQERYRAIQLVQGVAGVKEIIVRNLVVQR